MTETGLERLEPQLVWQRFLELTRIARPSKEEAEARAYVASRTESRALTSTVDAAGNLVVRVPASPGRERAPVVVLQAHLDMVCERDPESPFDAREGRIRVDLENGWLVARGTTLGADNGIGVAAALAAAEDESLTHGPLELLFTVSEEQGLEGAKALDSELVSGRLLVNLDGGEHGITIGCAGSVHTLTRLPLALEESEGVALEIRVSGALGGHSGGDIVAGRANANKALARVLASAWTAGEFRLASFAGGVSRNAIPREARATVVVAAEATVHSEEAAARELELLREHFRETDPALELSIVPATRVPSASEAQTERVLDLLAATPSGVVAMNPQLQGVVETSTSLTVVTTEQGVLTLASMTRSASAEGLEGVVASLQALARLSGAEVEVVPSYPPWRPNLRSRLLAAAEQTYERVVGTKPKLTVVHGGLECAILGEKLPGVEMISIGAEIDRPHAPGERVNVASTERFYRLLGALLDDLSRGRE
jgi:dipeptidase D